MSQGQVSFDWSGYPRNPGFKRDGTSRDAAESMRTKVGTLRDAVYQHIDGRGTDGSTADEAAQALGESVLAIRPRVTELLRMGLVADTTQRRPNISGRMAIVWEIVES